MLSFVVSGKRLQYPPSLHQHIGFALAGKKTQPTQSRVMVGVLRVYVPPASNPPEKVGLAVGRRHTLPSPIASASFPRLARFIVSLLYSHFFHKKIWFPFFRNRDDGTATVRSCGHCFLMEQKRLVWVYVAFLRKKENHIFGNWWCYFYFCYRLGITQMIFKTKKRRCVGGVLNIILSLL